MNVEKDDATGIITIDDDGDRKIMFKPYTTVNGKTYVYLIALELGNGGGDIEGVRFGREAVSWMFNETDCVKIFGYVDESNRASLTYANVGQWDTVTTFVDPKTNINYIVKEITIGKWLHRRGNQGLEKALTKKENT